MSGQKIANENTTNGVSGEPMGGMSGSYSNLASIPGTGGYIFAWQSRGAVHLTENAWLGAPYTQASPRWLNHNVAISIMTDKKTLASAEASSVVGAADGDKQINWITYSSTEDHQNVHVAAVNADYSIVTYETLTSPDCKPVPLGCTGTYAGTSFQVIDSKGAKVGEATVSTEAFVSGDIVTIGTDKVCWPYVAMTWDLSAPKDSGTPISQMSFACASLSGSGTASSPVATSKAAIVSPSSAAAVVGSISPEPVVTQGPSSAPVIASSVASPVISASSAPVSSTPASIPAESTTLHTQTRSTKPTKSVPASSAAATPSAAYGGWGNQGTWGWRGTAEDAASADADVCDE